MKNEGVSFGHGGERGLRGDRQCSDQGRNDDDEYYRERLYKETPGTVSGVPDGGTARKILLYWTGWKSSPFNVWYEDADVERVDR